MQLGEELGILTLYRAGKYILLKLWAPCPNANIDIQCVTAHGYGGPRFFPSVEAR
jgi:hypothetical protein